MKKTINKHNLPMQGLRKAAGDTKYHGDNCYTQISYDTATGDILTNYHCSIGQNSWTQYNDSDTITVCTTSIPMTMQQIADAIAGAVARHIDAADLR